MPRCNPDASGETLGFDFPVFGNTQNVVSLMKKTFVILILLTIFISCVEDKKQPIAEIEDSNLENEFLKHPNSKNIDELSDNDTFQLPFKKGWLGINFIEK